MVFNRSVSILAMLCVATQITNLVQGEKIEFINKVVSSGTNCFLESISETVQGKINEE